MGVTLMSYVPDYSVPGGIKCPVQGDGQFHHPKIGSKMSAVTAYSTDYLFPYLTGKPV
jgi:hypothetical protein